jgi:hypothetical protein
MNHSFGESEGVYARQAGENRRGKNKPDSLPRGVRDNAGHFHRDAIRFVAVRFVTTRLFRREIFFHSEIFHSEIFHSEVFLRQIFRSEVETSPGLARSLT